MAVTRRFVIPVSCLALLVVLFGAAGRVAAQHRAQQKNMRLVGHDDLQARSAYQPLVVEQGNRPLGTGQQRS